MPCAVCFPWNLPLAMNAQLSAEGAAIGLRFEQWLLYYLHVAIHQKDRWAGDLQPVLDQPKESVV